MTRVDPERAAVGATLARALTPRAVLTCLGVSAIPAIDRLARAAPSPCPPAAAPIWLWCAGQPVARAAVERAIGATTMAQAIAAELCAVDGDQLIAGYRLAPLGRGLIVCDRADRTDAARVPWPDDSTLHLASCLPSVRGRRWLDLGTGPATQPLAAGPGATAIRATDHAPRALTLGALGLALAGRADVELAMVTGLGAPGPGWDLVTLNAPIPRQRTGAIPDTAWHRGDDAAGFLAALWAAAPTLMAPDGELVVHSLIVDDDPRLAPPVDADGSVTIARYTPPGAPGYAITRWRPGGPRHRRCGEVALTIDHPFVTRADLDAIDAAAPASRHDMG